MKEVLLPENLVIKLEEIYRRLQDDYGNVADALKFSCSGCSDNCCDSYFLHHTYAEWAYLWLGFRQLEEVRREEILDRSRRWLQQCETAMKRDERPQVMCPLNEDGLCILYHHRLLVCRTHGVPAWLTRPDGREMRFPGCFRCQEIVEARFPGQQPPHVDRTPWLRQLAFLENEFLENKRHLQPKVRMTIAEMLVNGPPALPLPHCQRSLHNRPF